MSPKREENVGINGPLEKVKLGHIDRLRRGG
jgi:hypothetical protein